MAISWADSADKHRVHHDDAIHAIVNAYVVDSEFDVRGQGKHLRRLP